MRFPSTGISTSQLSLQTLELNDGSPDPQKHVQIFKAKLQLRGATDALPCMVF